MAKSHRSSAAAVETSLAAVAAIVRAAEQAQFDVDPVLPPALSRALSVISSVVKRHGSLLDTVLAETLLASGRYIVLRHLALPITQAALQAIEDGEAGPLPLDGGPVVETVDADVVVVEPVTGWAVAIQVKRGGGKTDARKRRAVQAGLRAAALTLPDFLRSRGVEEARVGTAIIVDGFGRSGFDPAMTVTGPDLDAYFDVPVWGALGAATAALAAALRELFPVLLRPVIEEVERDRVAPRRRPGAMRPVSPFPRAGSGEPSSSVVTLATKRGRA